MTWVAGADGCKAGWFWVARDLESGALRSGIATSEDLLAMKADVLAIDIPIGLPETGKRECDVEARRCLGSPRCSSVFPAPIRSALGARSREEASRITQAADGRRVGAQAYAIYPKIRSLDALMPSHSDARDRICEVHPEVSFWAWNQERTIAAKKKSSEGRRERLRLLETWLGTSAFEDARRSHPKRDVGDDDILDAFAALWTATRIARGEAVSLPMDPPRDAMDLPMRIVY
jgi:predicted RNase H-like nuclease